VRTTLIDADLVSSLFVPGCEVTVFDLVQGFKDKRVSFVVGNLVDKVN